MISLAQLPACTPAVVVSLPRMRPMAQRLLSLGICPGAEIENLQNRGRGPLIVRVHGVRVALGRGEASRVAVQPLAVGVCSEPDTGDPDTAVAS